MVGKRNTYKMLFSKPEGRRLFGKPGHRWEDNIRMDIKEIEWEAWTKCIWIRRGTGGGLFLIMIIDLRIP
jgi:hypothetical protein